MEQIEPDLSYFCSRLTYLGKAAIVWNFLKTRPVIQNVFLSSPGLSAEKAVRKSWPDAKISSCSEIDSVMDQLVSFLNGNKTKFDLKNLDFRSCTEFQKKVMLTVFAIPRGKVSTYGDVAEKAGCTGGARAIGMVMANNPFPAIIPCHRVVRADGSLGGFGYGLKMKYDLLKMEGVIFVDKKSVAPESIV